MSTKLLMVCSLVTLAACSTNDSLLDDYEQVPATPVVRAPESSVSSTADPEVVSQGRYMVELLGCGACHTDGALMGVPKDHLALAGSSIGIAHSNPFLTKYPGVVFAPNLTPDTETGIGRMSDAHLKASIQGLAGRHGRQKLRVMPVIAYSSVNDEDINAIIVYLRSLAPTRHRVPKNVPEGKSCADPYVHFGVYRSRETL